jgi:hypothetical protein
MRSRTGVRTVLSITPSNPGTSRVIRPFFRIRGCTFIPEAARCKASRNDPELPVHGRRRRSGTNDRSSNDWTIVGSPPARWPIRPPAFHFFIDNESKQCKLDKKMNGIFLLFHHFASPEARPGASRGFHRRKAFRREPSPSRRFPASPPNPSGKADRPAGIFPPGGNGSPAEVRKAPLTPAPAIRLLFWHSRASLAGTSFRAGPTDRPVVGFGPLAGPKSRPLQ